MGRIGVYPGTFNPLTIAHLAIAEVAARQCDLARVDLAVSTVSLAKEHLELPLLQHRVEVLEAAASTRPWLGVRVTGLQLLADISVGYDVLVMGSDKWTQLCDPSFYGGDARRRDEAIRRLPELAVAPRPPHPVPAGATTLLVDPGLGEVSASAARQGARDLMAPEASALDRRTGAWSDPDRYRSFVAEERPKSS